MSELRPFHIAFPVRDLQEARHFYGEILGCPEGRSADIWVDFNLYGHQIVAHYQPPSAKTVDPSSHHNPVDGHDVPVPHFGVVLTMDDWKALRDRLIGAGIEFKSVSGVSWLTTPKARTHLSSHSAHLFRRQPAFCRS